MLAGLHTLIIFLSNSRAARLSILKVKRSRVKLNCAIFQIISLYSLSLSLVVMKVTGAHH